MVAPEPPGGAFEPVEVEVAAFSGVAIVKAESVEEPLGPEALILARYFVPGVKFDKVKLLAPKLLRATVRTIFETFELSELHVRVSLFAYLNVTLTETFTRVEFVDDVFAVTDRERILPPLLCVSNTSWGSNNMIPLLSVAFTSTL